MPHIKECLGSIHAQFWIPEEFELNTNYDADPYLKIHRLKRTLPYSISRLFENLFSEYYFPKVDKLLVLGDFPLHGFPGQVVLVEQLLLVKPEVNPNVSDSTHYRILRYLFRRNIPFAKYLLVQNGEMKSQLIKSYPELEGKIKIIPLPVPSWFCYGSKRTNIDLSNGITLFYPAANYPHKNHALFPMMDGTIKKLQFSVKIVITLDPSELNADLSELSWVVPVGRLSSEACLAQYKKSDGLFFPSLLEAYGLPLVEAMAAEIPIICADLPYARWLCESNAIYFDPFNGESACKAISDLHKRLSSFWVVDWTEALKKIPKNWNEVAYRILELL